MLFQQGLMSSSIKNKGLIISFVNCHWKMLVVLGYISTSKVKISAIKKVEFALSLD